MNFVVDTASVTGSMDEIAMRIAAPRATPAQPPRRIHGTYDSARLGDEYKNIWANADRFDADSANNKETRHRLMSHSRYEMVNNGYYDGIAATYCTDLIGTGPMLRMQTQNPDFNEMVESAFFYWMKSTNFRRKLWTMTHAKHIDGETFAVMALNPKVRHVVQLDLKLYEAEQVQTPLPPTNDPKHIDGIILDDFGDPEFFEFLKRHPGAANQVMPYQDVDRVPADRVLHWFKLRRPGQHRGVPEMASTLNVGAAFRRWREAILAAAETAADYSVLIKTGFQPERIAELDPLMAFEIEKRMAVNLPEGWDAFQMKSEHPNATYEAFHKTLINEMARPKHMPLNKAQCNSADYNFASGRLDHLTYQAVLDVEREDCNDLVLDKLFEEWFPMAVRNYGWFGGSISTVTRAAYVHTWNWPRHRVADVESEARANEIRLKTGQVSLEQLYIEMGQDIEDVIPKWAESHGVEESEIRKRTLDVNMPPLAPPPAKAIPQPSMRVAAHSSNGNGSL